MNRNELTLKIEELLPQTQCRQCGSKDCAEYAKRISEGELHNRCAPGGADLIEKLSILLGRAPLPFDASCGEHVAPEIAVIDNRKCIGCRICAEVCPTDAVIGSAKHQHTVDPDYCNGCCLCQLACPVDCIDMVRIQREWTVKLAALSKSRYKSRLKRLEKKKQAEEARLSKSMGSADRKQFLADLLRRKGIPQASSEESPGKAPSVPISLKDFSASKKHSSAV